MGGGRRNGVGQEGPALVTATPAVAVPRAPSPPPPWRRGVAALERERGRDGVLLARNMNGGVDTVWVVVLPNIIRPLDARPTTW